MEKGGNTNNHNRKVITTMSRRPGIASFRRAQSKSRDAKGSRGTRTPWQHFIFTMEPGTTAPTRFLPPPRQDDEGNVPFDYPFLYGYHGFNPAHTCTADEAVWPEFEGKCVFCHYNDRDDDFRNKWYKGVRTVLQLIDFRYTHWDLSGDKPQVFDCADEGPNPRRPRCRHCLGTDESLKVRHFGGSKRWELSDAQMAQVTDVFMRLQQLCVADAKDGEGICNEKIHTLAYVCSSEDCGHEIITERDLMTKDCDEAINSEVECPECGQVDFLTPITMCESEAHEATPATLYDKILDVACSGEAKTNKSGKKRTVKNFSFNESKAPWSMLADDLRFAGIKEEEIDKMMILDNPMERYAPERVRRSEFTDGGNFDLDGYRKSVWEKQSEACKKPVPPGWISGSSNATTGRSAWNRGGN